MADFRHLGTVQSGLCVIMQNLIKRYLERLRENGGLLIFKMAAVRRLGLFKTSRMLMLMLFVLA